MSTLESGVVFPPRGVHVESVMMRALLWGFTGVCGVFKHTVHTDWMGLPAWLILPSAA